MFCTSPITVYKKGETVPVMNPATGLPEWQQVACGQCPTCVKGRKNDWAGRLICEAREAASVYFLTLTYKEEPEEFVYHDVQKMFWSLRKELQRKTDGTTVRFFCVGERGNKFGRIHWHLLLFFDRPHDLRRMTPGELWKHWPHGWTSIDHVPTDDIVRRVRYCAKYAVKSLGQEGKSCRIRCSLKPAIGGKYLARFAHQLAEAGLPLRGFFTIRDLRWERGPRKGEHVRYRLKGSSARNVCRDYVQRWCEVQSAPWPRTNFLSRYGNSDRCAEFLERRQRWPETVKATDYAVDLSKARPVVYTPPEPPPRNDWDWCPITILLDEKGRAIGIKEAEAFLKWDAREEQARDVVAVAQGWDYRHQSEADRFARSEAVRRAGGDPVHPAFARFVDSGDFASFPPGEAREAFIRAEIDLPTDAGFIAVDPRGVEFARAWFKRKVALAGSGTGFVAVEKVDPETGEVGIGVAPFDRKARPVAASGDPAEPYAPRIAGLARRATPTGPRGETRRDLGEVERNPA